MSTCITLSRGSHSSHLHRSISAPQPHLLQQMSRSGTAPQGQRLTSYLTKPRVEYKKTSYPMVSATKSKNSTPRPRSPLPRSSSQVVHQPLWRSSSLLPKTWTQITVPYTQDISSRRDVFGPVHRTAVGFGYSECDCVDCAVQVYPSYEIINELAPSVRPYANYRGVWSFTAAPDTTNFTFNIF